MFGVRCLIERLNQCLPVWGDWVRASSSVLPVCKASPQLAPDDSSGSWSDDPGGFSSLGIWDELDLDCRKLN